MAGLQAIICGMIDWRSVGAALAASSMLFWAARDADAQSYPQRPVRLIVPAPAGGPTDVPARLIADGLSGSFSQRFVVENRVGAGGLVAGGVRAHPPPHAKLPHLTQNTGVSGGSPPPRAETPLRPRTGARP